MEEKVFFLNSKGDRLAGIITNQSDSTNSPIVILCHGFTTHKNRPKYVELAKRFTAKNIATLRFDFFGHGESEGSFANITISEGVDNILQAIKFLKDRGYSKIGLVGCSFGGITSLVASAKTNELTALALISPVSDYPATERLRRSEEDIAKWKNDGFTIHYNSKGEEFKLNYSFWEDAQKNIVYDIADKIKIPTLIVHGDADDVVPIEQSRKTAKLISNCKLVEIKEADHRYEDPDHLEQMLDVISEFVIEQLNKEKYQKQFFDDRNLGDPKLWLTQGNAYRQLYYLGEKSQGGSEIRRFKPGKVRGDLMSIGCTLPYIASIAAELFMKGYLIASGANTGDVRKINHDLSALRRECYELSSNYKFQNKQLVDFTDVMGPTITTDGGMRYPRSRIYVCGSVIDNSIDLLEQILREKLTDNDN